MTVCVSALTAAACVGVMWWGLTRRAVDQADESVMINAVEVEVEVAESEKKHKRRGKK